LVIGDQTAHVPAQHTLSISHRPNLLPGGANRPGTAGKDHANSKDGGSGLSADPFFE
jgi:hypothetical protein